MSIKSDFPAERNNLILLKYVPTKCTNVTSLGFGLYEFLQ